MSEAVQVAIITTGGTVLVALVGVLVELVRRQHKVIGEVREATHHTREQVLNSHTTNLRDDIDRVLGGIEQLHENQRQHGYELGHLRRDLQQERRERMALSERVDSHMHTVATTAASSAAASVAAVVGSGDS